MRRISDFLTRKERLRIRWSNFKFFVYAIFHRVSRFQNWEANETIVLQPTKKKIIISGVKINPPGKLIIGQPHSEVKVPKEELMPFDESKDIDDENSGFDALTDEQKQRVNEAFDKKQIGIKIRGKND